MTLAAQLTRCDKAERTLHVWGARFSGLELFIHVYVIPIAKSRWGTLNFYLTTSIQLLRFWYRVFASRAAVRSASK